MRPASEIHSALALVNASFDRLADSSQIDNDAIRNLGLLREVLAWVTGDGVDIGPDAPNPWLAAYLLDDPPQIGPPPGGN